MSRLKLTERYQPIAFLETFNVVDTPGTNTMVAAASGDHRKFHPARRPRALCFLGGEPVGRHRLGPAQLRKQEMA